MELFLLFIHLELCIAKIKLTLDEKSFIFYQEEKIEMMYF